MVVFGKVLYLLSQKLGTLGSQLLPVEFHEGSSYIQPESHNEDRDALETSVWLLCVALETGDIGSVSVSNYLASRVLIYRTRGA